MGRKEQINFYKKADKNLNSIQLENVTCIDETSEPVLLHVDFELPTDQTLIIQALNPNHAVSFLKLLAGRLSPEGGRVLYNEKDMLDWMEDGEKVSLLIGSYFESDRPAPDSKIRSLVVSSQFPEEEVLDAFEQISLTVSLDHLFSSLSYEDQKMILLLRALKNKPEMIILEDPAMGLSEGKFLDFLDYTHFLQRRGHLRHVFMTNNHPTASKQLHDSISLLLADGLIYQEEALETKKAVHF